MSQASKHVDWCLNKAQKEIEECRKLGKRLKHRGLLKSNPDWSMSAGFYCIYHCFLAIAAKFGYGSGNQTCTISLMRYLHETNKIKLDEKYIELLEYENMEDIQEESVIDLRENYTYGVQITVKDEAKLNELKKICKELVDITKEIIYS